MTRIFYIEDEEFLGKIVMETLEHLGYRVKWVTDGAVALDQFREYKPDICIIDIMLPNVDGYTIGRSIRGINPTIPVIFLTARTETSDVLKGFESGGTDYVKKPFSIEELVARIENQLSLSGNSHPVKKENEKIDLGKFVFYPGLFELHNGSEVTRLSHRDTQVLTVLAANRNVIVDRRELLMMVWGDDSFFNSRNLDVYIRKIRNYLVSDPSLEIKTLKGKGYLFVVES